MFPKNTLGYFRKALAGELFRKGFSRKHARAASETFRYTGESLVKGSPLPEDDVLIDLAVDYYNQHKSLPNPYSGYVEDNSEFMTWGSVFEKLKKEKRPTIRQMVMEYEMAAERHDLLKKTNIPILLLPTNRRIAEAALHYRILHGHLPNSQSRFFYEEKSHYKWGTILHRLRHEKNLTLGELVDLHLEEIKKSDGVASGKSYRTTSHFPDNDAIVRAAIRHRTEHGDLPHKSAGAARIKKHRISWKTIHETLWAEQHTTITALVKKYEEAKRLQREEDLKSKPGMISARNVFEEAVAFIKHSREIPDPQNPDHIIAGVTVLRLNSYFRLNCVNGYRHYLMLSTGTPKSLNDFLVFSGLATRQDGRVVPALPQTIEDLSVNLR